MTATRVDAPRTDLRRLFVGAIAPLAGLAVLVAQLAYWLPHHAVRDVSTTDVPGYYRAALHVLHGEPLYREAAGGVLASYIYPPTFAVLMSPLALLGPTGFQAVWYAGVLVAFWCFAAGLVRLSGRDVTVRTVLVAGALLQFVPGAGITMSFGNADLAVWALCTAALAGSSRWAALGAAVKVYPGWLVLASTPRAMARAVLVGAAILGATALVVGVRGFTEWAALAGTLAQGVDWHTNVSVSFRLAHLVGHDGLTSKIAAGGTVAALIAAREWIRDEALRGAVVLVAAMALAPICWIHYAPALLIPGAAWLGRLK